MRRGNSADALGMSMYPPLRYAQRLNRTLRKHERTSTNNGRNIILKTTYQALQIPLGISHTLFGGTGKVRCGEQGAV